MRACAAITRDTSFVVIGSQAVLMEHPNAPADLLLSNEIDLYPANHPERAELIDGADADWVRALLRHRTIGIKRLVERLLQLDASLCPPARLVTWARRRAAEAATL